MGLQALSGYKQAKQKMLQALQEFKRAEQGCFKLFKRSELTKLKL